MNIVSSLEVLNSYLAEDLQLLHNKLSKYFLFGANQFWLNCDIALIYLYIDIIQEVMQNQLKDIFLSSSKIY